MLEAFYKTYQYRLKHAHTPIRRVLMDQIDWEHRLIAIKGARGVGKTDFLLARARELEEAHEKCLYVNFNDFYFTQHTLVEFAKEFVKTGGRYLLLDQMFKYPNWSKELRSCYNKFKDLYIVFSASPVMRLVEENHDIGAVVKMYNLRGYSFREYLNLHTGMSVQPVTLDELLAHHEELAQRICRHCDPMPHFREYLKRGYYPSSSDNEEADSVILKMMNVMLEVDVLVIKQIDVTFLPKLRKLLYIMLTSAPCSLNITAIAAEIGLSRITTMNYIKYLKDARLLNLLYQEGKRFPMKPSKVYMQNTNIAYQNGGRTMQDEDIYETYFYHALHADYPVNATERSAMFIVDGKYYFDVFADAPEKPSIRPCAIGNLTIGEGNNIPLWMLGLLY
ncbi:MAG: AAA family ATPase [Paludibacteraceae bacterium]|nr:AAA family ATPase [Paludibacteraceae bacterium]